MDLEDEVGAIREGLLADVVGVQGDPLQDLKLLRAVRRYQGRQADQISEPVTICSAYLSISCVNPNGSIKLTLVRQLTQANHAFFEIIIFHAIANGVMPNSCTFRDWLI